MTELLMNLNGLLIAATTLAGTVGTILGSLIQRWRSRKNRAAEDAALETRIETMLREQITKLETRISELKGEVDGLHKARAADQESCRKRETELLRSCAKLEAENASLKTDNENKARTIVELQARLGA